MKTRFVIAIIAITLLGSCFASAYTGFRATPLENDPLTYHFSLNGPEPDGVSVKSVIYEFGDGTKSEDLETDHSYKKKGTYNAFCRITWSDEYGTEYSTVTRGIVKPGLLTIIKVNPTPSKVPTQVLTPFTSAPVATLTIRLTPLPTITEYRAYTPGPMVQLTPFGSGTPVIMF